MVSRGVFYVVTAILFVVGILFIGYQHVTFEIPFTPGQMRKVWTVEAKVEFEPTGSGAATVDLSLPAVQPGVTQLKQSTAGLGFGTTYIYHDDGASYVQWTKRNPAGLQTLYYRADFLMDDTAQDSSMTVPELKQNVEPEPYLTAMRSIAESALQRSSNPFSLAVQAISIINSNTEESTLLLSSYKKPELLVHILELAKIPSRIVGVLTLEDGRRNRNLSPRVAVFDGTQYEIFNPFTGDSGVGPNELIWNNHDGSILDIQGGTNAQVSFSIIKNSMSASEAGHLKVETMQASGKDVLSLSIDTLPIEEQSLFKSILLLPIGVLIVVFLRILIGIKTSGTFMPVLIAMAFLQTSLLVGLIGFVSIVCIGLIVRSWLSHLNLLLVARISAVIITVIVLIGAISIITYKIGLTEGIKVTFFPMIILSWTIERMSILWEEEGYREVLKQGGGSLFVAVCAFLAMNSEVIQHITFNFLGLQFVILALVLIMGNYTGFRLTELKRFKPLSQKIIEAHEQGVPYEADRLNAKRKELKANPHQTIKKWEEEHKLKEDPLNPQNESDK